MNILGISAYYHDSAAALIKDGEIIACAQEERFTRKKHDEAFPSLAIQYCLKESGIALKDVDYIVYYDKPLLTFDRLLETYFSFAPRGFKSFLLTMPVWLKNKLFLKSLIKRELTKLNHRKKLNTPILFTQHHQAHAASAFFPSPFKNAAVLCLDGVGEWATTSLWLGQDNQLIPQWEIKFPHSLGLLYSAFTFFTGFRVNSGEYKLMGLAPYGEPKYVDLIREHLIDIKEDGTFHLNMKYFDFATGLTMTNKHFDALFDRQPRSPDSPITQQDMDFAKSIQIITEEILLKLTRAIRKEYDIDNLCLAGGVALNCVANGKLIEKKIFKNIWIQPAAGDAGGAIGSALAVWYEYLKNPRFDTSIDHMKGSYLGPRYSNTEICEYLNQVGANYQILDDEALIDKTVSLLINENVIGWFQGRMEFGPRALGNRSIIGDARSTKMQSIMNLKIKFRESFRPFAPAILAEKCNQWFSLDDKMSPYMLLVGPIHNQYRINNNDKDLIGIEKLKMPRSTIPAVTHVDYSARVQTVHKETNPRFHRLIEKFDIETSCPLLINTSFNVRGEPIVCTPQDAFRCFMSTNIDALVMENVFLLKSEQPEKVKNSYQIGETVGVD